MSRRKRHKRRNQNGLVSDAINNPPIRDVQNTQVAPPGASALELKIQTGTLKHLGIKLYQRPADVISELVANAWDADASIVRVVIDVEDGRITVEDDGCGMTYAEAQECYLQVGRDRRAHLGSDVTKMGRPVLGRKGIGKFSSFGIASQIQVETVSNIDRSYTSFMMDISDMELSHQGEINNILRDQKWVEGAQSPSGTKITLGKLTKNINSGHIDRIRGGLSRRFLLTENGGFDGFTILVNGERVQKSFEEQKQIIFPRDIDVDQYANYDIHQVVDDWAISTVCNQEVRWRIGFTETPIQEEELCGIAIYARGKLAQVPFFFNQRGGSASEFAKQYITGQMIMDFVDSDDNDLISSERQRVDFESDLGQCIENWGQSLLNKLGIYWKSARATQRADKVFNGQDSRSVQLRSRLEKLSSPEQRTVRRALGVLAGGTTTEPDESFFKVADHLLFAYEGKVLAGLIEEIADSKEIDSAKLLEVLNESDVMASIQIGQASLLKLEAIAHLRKMIDARELENEVRDHIASHPWLVHRKFESYCKETSLTNILNQYAHRFNADDVYNGRIDLMLANREKSNYLLLEFMRPGKRLDADHIERATRYAFDIRRHIQQETNNPSRRKALDEVWVVAEHATDNWALEKISDAKEKGIYFYSWDEFLRAACEDCSEVIQAIKDRNPDDARIQDILNEI